MQKIKLFKKLGNYENGYTRIVSIDEFIDEYSALQLGNGGSWCRRNKKYRFVTMKKNGKLSLLWKYTDKEYESVKKEFEAIVPENYGVKIQYIKIHGIDSDEPNRTIRKDIKDFYSKLPCVHCGTTSNLVCDHKNDLYNDTRVLNTKTQTLDDFQSLCTHCNLLKRQVCKETLIKNKRYPATKIPCLKIWNIEFTKGDETLDITDPNAMIGTYWYDPIDFHKKIKSIYKEKINKE